MQIRSTFTLSSLASITALTLVGGLLGCGDDGGSGTPDAAVKDIGFSKPTAALRANMEMASNQWVDVGPADLSCLGTPASDLATTIPVMLSSVVYDFQEDDILRPNATVTAFPEQRTASPFDTQTTDADAAFTVTIPVGTKRFGFKISDSSSLDTLLLNQKVDPSTPTQTISRVQSVSKTTATTLPALINVSRTPGTGVLAGAMRDCQDREVSNFIATVSSTKSTVTHLEGADTYYFSSAVGLPVRHAQQKSASADGLFMIIELSPTPTAYVQVWGYKDDAALAADQLELIAELETAVIAETVITGSYEPIRTP